jgi:hypothetical protein
MKVHLGSGPKTGQSPANRHSQAAPGNEKEEDLQTKGKKGFSLLQISTTMVEAGLKILSPIEHSSFFRCIRVSFLR